MHIEHLFFSVAIALIAGLVYYRFTHRNPWWVIVVMSLVPDIDWFIMKVELLYWDEPLPMIHGDWHNIPALMAFSLIAALLLLRVGIPLADGIIFSSIGFGLHLFEDALMFAHNYAIFWPVYNNPAGFGILPSNMNFFGIGNTVTMQVGIVLMIGAEIVYFVAMPWLLDREPARHTGGCES